MDNPYFRSYEDPEDSWNEFVKNQCQKPGWKLKTNDLGNLCGDFYYDRPPTFFERLFKTYIPQVILHADQTEIDTDYKTEPRRFQIIITKQK